MNSKLLSYIIAALVVLGISLTLNEMYSASNSALKGSIYYLSAPITIAVLLIIFKKHTKDSTKWLNTLSLSLYAIFALMLTLIALYSSPSDKVEPLSAALFFFAGVLAICNMVLIKYTKVSSKQEDISTIHKAFRYLILVALIFFLFNAALNIYDIKSSQNNNTQEHSLPLG